MRGSKDAVLHDSWYCCKVARAARLLVSPLVSKVEDCTGQLPVSHHKSAMHCCFVQLMQHRYRKSATQCCALCRRAIKMASHLCMHPSRMLDSVFTRHSHTSASRSPIIEHIDCVSLQLKTSSACRLTCGWGGRGRGCRGRHGT